MGADAGAAVVSVGFCVTGFVSAECKLRFREGGAVLQPPFAGARERAHRVGSNSDAANNHSSRRQIQPPDAVVVADANQPDDVRMGADAGAAVVSVVFCVTGFVSAECKLRFREGGAVLQ